MSDTGGLHVGPAKVKACKSFLFVLLSEQLISLRSQRQDIFARDELETSDTIRLFIYNLNALSKVHNKRH